MNPVESPEGQFGLVLCRISESDTPLMVTVTIDTVEENASAGIIIVAICR
jgi:hypothetical protein